jgi:hypothetical protein
MRRALFLLTLLSTACRHAAKPGTPEPEAETTVKVQNQNLFDMTVYVVRDQERIRLGVVPGFSTHLFTLRRSIVGTATQLRFELYPIGGRAQPRSETITVIPGDAIELIIPPA